MKKVILAVILVVVLIAGGLGGAVMAATPPDDSPKGMWAIIVEGIGDILDELGIIEGKVDEMTSQIPVIEMVEGALLNQDYDIIGDLNNPIMHVSVTIWKNGTSLAGTSSLYEGAIYLDAYANDDNIRVIDSIRNDDFSTSQWNAFTYEFNARKWKVSSTRGDVDPNDLIVEYTATMTYMPTE